MIRQENGPSREKQISTRKKLPLILLHSTTQLNQV